MAPSKLIIAHDLEAEQCYFPYVLYSADKFNKMERTTFVMESEDVQSYSYHLEKDMNSTVYYERQVATIEKDYQVLEMEKTVDKNVYCRYMFITNSTEDKTELVGHWVLVTIYKKDKKITIVEACIDTGETCEESYGSYLI